MKSISRSSRTPIQVRQQVSPARSTVAIAITSQRTNVSVPNDAKALVATGAVLLAAGLFLAALDD